MMMFRLTLLFFCSGLVPIQAAEPVHRTIFGLDPALQEGAFALRMGNYEEGLSLTLAGLDSTVTRRNKVNALINLCAGYVGTGEYVKALQYCDQALKLNDQNWHAYNNRALALLGVGLIVAARSDLDKGFALNPDSATLAKVALMVDEQERSQLMASDTDRNTD